MTGSTRLYPGQDADRYSYFFLTSGIQTFCENLLISPCTECSPSLEGYPVNVGMDGKRACCRDFRRAKSNRRETGMVGRNGRLVDGDSRLGKLDMKLVFATCRCFRESQNSHQDKLGSKFDVEEMLRGTRSKRRAISSGSPALSPHCSFSSHWLHI